FTIDHESASPIAEICRRLEGMPLAIELAAARLRVLTAPELLRMLDRSLDVLRSSARDGALHQQTLRSTIEWSYRLLDPAEQRLLRAAAVFAGGFAVDALAQVAGSDSFDVLDPLERLVAHHLVRVVASGDDTRRFDLFDPIREFAAAELLRLDEDLAVRDAHAAWAQSLVDETAARLTTPDQTTALQRLDRELDNIRAALGWRSGPTESTA